MKFKSFYVLSVATVKNAIPPIRIRFLEKVFHGLVASNFSPSASCKSNKSANSGISGIFILWVTFHCRTMNLHGTKLLNSCCFCNFFFCLYITALRRRVFEIVEIDAVCFQPTDQPKLTSL